MSLTCHLDMTLSPLITLHPLEQVEAWFYDMTCDDDNTPLRRGHGAFSLDDIIAYLEDISHVMGSCTSR
jgi:hypothetical protein